MVSTFTPNLNIEEPARGDYVGTWDTPVNANMTLLDLVAGAITTVSLNNTPVVLSAAQFRSKTITFNSTLTGNVAITFPTSFTKSYEIEHACTGSSAFIITLGTTAAGGQVISVPAGEIVEVVNDGTNLKFKNLARVGTYWDYAGSSVPNWVAGCTKPPYLNCDGTAVSSTLYPVLFGMIGATLPDSRGRSRIALDAGVGRVTVAGSGMAGNTILAGGGDQGLQAHSHGVADPGHTHGSNMPAAGGVVILQGTGNAVGVTGTSGGTINPAATGIGIAAAGSGGSQNMQPSYVGGLTLIRAA